MGKVISARAFSELNKNYDSIKIDTRANIKLDTIEVCNNYNHISGWQSINTKHKDGKKIECYKTRL